MNNFLIDGIVSSLEDTKISMEEAIKKAWYHNLNIRGVNPTEKELLVIQRKVRRDWEGIWRLTCDKNKDLYGEVDDLSDTAKSILKSFIDLGFDYIYKYEFGFALSDSCELGLWIKEPEKFNTQMMETTGIFNSLETDCLYEIRKLLELCE